MRHGRMKPLGSGLQRMVTSLGGKQHADKAAVANAWTAAVGADVAKHTYVKGVRRGELLVAVDSPVWATQLQAIGDQLKSRLNEEIGKELVRTVRFNVSQSVQAEREQEEKEAAAARGYGGEKVAPEALSEEEMGRAEALVEGIQNEALREAALKAIVAEKQWHKGSDNQE